MAENWPEPPPLIDIGNSLIGPLRDFYETLNISCG